MKRFFPPEPDFHSLSIKDLLEARETYHVYLYNLENVIATAIGRYRIRESDPDMNNPNKKRSRHNAPPRTLGNSVVKPWSWPCILVFVKEWNIQEELIEEPDQVVPRFLYMSDGRIIPTCVILALKNEEAPPPLWNLNFPSELIGGGYPIVTEVQAEQHIGSLGCLVTDGDTVYALTNRHVTGEEMNSNRKARDIYTFINGERVKVGNTHYKNLGKKPFQQVYHGWPGSRAYSNLDVGLIKIDDINYWTAQVFGIGEMDDPVDLNSSTISLDLIGCPVRAFGGASGEMVGEIDALFYRYKSIGGFDYISDLLIGQIEGQISLRTQPGDSGTVWFYDPSLLSQEKKKGLTGNKIEVTRGSRAKRLRPIALQWGGHTLMNSHEETELNLALATSLSTICRELDVDIVRSWNIGHSEYWGKLGHYKIAAKACALLSNLKLSKLMNKNLNAISFDDESIRQGELRRIDSKQFVPLADVPDLVWRSSRKKDSGNHFADMDEEGKGEFDGKTLLQITSDPKNVSINVWNAFYDSLGVDYKRGAVPFRAWQIYNDMIKFASKGDVERFVCAAGILSHYVGDACQPLHVSKLHHGRPGHSGEEKVHSYYETNMMDRFAADLIAEVNNRLKNTTVKADLNGGHECAVSVIELMRDAIKELPPIDIIEAYNGASNESRISRMFRILGKKTAACVSKGCVRLASIWESAWKEGNGNKISESKLVPVKRQTLKQIYNDKEFLEPYRLQDERFLEVLK